MKKRLKSIHPGYYLKNAIENLNLNQSKIAMAIGVNPSVINEICNEKRNMSPEMSLKLGKYLQEAGLNANFWSRVQSKYNIDEALMNVNLNSIQPIKLDFKESIIVGN